MQYTNKYKIVLKATIQGRLEKVKRMFVQKRKLIIYYRKRSITHKSVYPIKLYCRHIFSVRFITNIRRLIWPFCLFFVAIYIASDLFSEYHLRFFLYIRCLFFHQ